MYIYICYRKFSTEDIGKESSIGIHPGRNHRGDKIFESLKSHSAPLEDRFIFEVTNEILRRCQAIFGHDLASAWMHRCLNASVHKTLRLLRWQKVHN